MAKKIVRGITDVKTINNQDFDTNNVNDLLSDGQYNYIHRKKGKGEEYHNLTDNIKTISSDNTDLLTVTNNNKTTNTATLHPKHDKQKEQVLESTRNTISIHHGTNGTAEKTTVDVNFEKVQEKLTAGDGITIQGQTISASGGAPASGVSVSLQDFSNPETGLSAVKYTITSGRDVMTQFTFLCPPGTHEFVITEALKDELLDYLAHGDISSGAITITGSISDNNIVMKLVNSNYAAENVLQQETFTFYKRIGGGDAV